MEMRSELLPFAYRDGRLCLEGVDLTGLAASLDGRAAWLISHAAVEAAVAAASTATAANEANEANGASKAIAAKASQAASAGEPTSGVPPAGAPSPGACCIEVGAVGPLAVLGQLAAAGWWAGVRSSHELTLALEAGFPPERLLACGGVRDDGFVKDALAAGVAVMKHADVEERVNAARIAALLDHELPPQHGEPPDAPAGLLDCCGGMLAPVLRPSPALTVDAVCPRLSGPRQVLALHAATTAAEQASLPGTLTGLGACDQPQAALVPSRVLRGDWVVLPGAAAAVRPVDPAHPAACTVLVRGESWRLLAGRPLPPELD